MPILPSIRPTFIYTFLLSPPSFRRFQHHLQRSGFPIDADEQFHVVHEASSEDFHGRLGHEDAVDDRLEAGRQVGGDQILRGGATLIEKQCITMSAQQSVGPSVSF